MKGFDISQIQEQLKKIASDPKTAQRTMKGVQRAGKYFGNPMYRMGINSAIFGGIGVAGGLIDKEDDTALSLIGKGVTAVGLEYATEEALVMGSQALLKHRGLPNALVDPMLKKMNIPEEHHAKIKGQLDQGMKKMIPGLNKGKLAGAGIGSALGLMYTMMNNEEDGVLQTASNLFIGAGLGVMGSEIIEHLGKDKRSVPQKAVDNFKESDIGKLMTKNIQRIMDTPEGKGFHSQLNKIFQSDEGKALLGHVDNIMSGDLNKILSIDTTSVQGNIQAVGEKMQDALSSPEGKTFVEKLQKLPSTPEGQEMFQEMNQYVQTKVQTGIKETGEKIHGLAGQLKGSGDKIAEVSDSAAKHINGILDGDFGKQVQPILQKHGLSVDEAKTKVDDIFKMISQKSKDLDGDFSTHVDEIWKTFTNKVDEFTAGTAAAPLDTAEAKATVEGRKENATVADMHQDDIKNNSSVSDEQFTENAKAKSRKVGKYMKGGAIVGAAILAAGSLLDVQRDLKEDRQAVRHGNDYEREQQKRKHKEDKTMGQMFGYGHTPNMGQLAIDMFNERIGHYKMGNAKFQ